METLRSSNEPTLFALKEGPSPLELTEIDDTIAYVSPDEQFTQSIDTEPINIDHTPPLCDLSQTPIERSLDLYFAEIRAQPLLTAEEVQCAKEIEAAKVATIVLLLSSSSVSMTSEEHAELQRIQEKGEAARAHMIRANTRWVVAIAKQYREKSAMDFQDLIAEGNIGLTIATDKYDYQKGTRFTTYATWWIRQAIARALHEKGYTLPIPEYLIKHMKPLATFTRAFEQQQHRSPTPKEIMNGTDIPNDAVMYLLKALRRPKQFEDSVGEDGAEFGDLFTDPHATTVEEQIEELFLPDGLEEIFTAAQLTFREIAVLVFRFGLGGGEPKTLQEVGNLYGKVREMIRKNEEKALKKLRALHARTNHL